MSLILDALRKSAGERQRGQAPTLASAVGLTPRRRPHPARMPVALALLAGTAGAGWWLGFGQAPVSDTLADRGPAESGGGGPSAELMTAADNLAGVPALADSAPALRPEAVQLPLDDVAQMGEAQSRMVGGMVAGGGAAALPMPVGTVYTPEVMTANAEPAPAPPPMTPAAASAPVAAEAVPVAALPPAASSQAMPPADPVVAPPPPVAVPVENLLTVDELDYSVRRELPALDISMYVYNADPERRFVIVGGKRYPRKDPTGALITKIDDKVDLLEIRADGAVLEFNGQRFLLPRGR